MAKKLYEETDIQNIANSIRTKTSSTDTYKVSEMSAAIDNIETGITPTGTLDITENGEYNVTNYANANVNVSGGSSKQYFVDQDEVQEITTTNSTVYTAVFYNNYANKLLSRIIDLPKYKIKYTSSASPVISFLFANLPKLTSDKFDEIFSFDFRNNKPILAERLFYNATELTRVPDIFNYFDYSAATNFSYMFYSCTKLNDISNLSNINTSSLTNMSYMFGLCKNLSDFSALNNWDLSKVTNLSYAFFTSGIKNADMFSGESPTLTSNGMSSIFQGCQNLTNINGLSNINTSNVTSLSGLCYLCINLTDISAMSNWDTSKVTTLSGAFRNCTKLNDKHVENVFNNLNLSKVASIENIFYKNTFENLDLSSTTLNNVTNYTYSFGYCNNLKNIKLPAYTGTSKINMQNAFAYCPKLKKVDMKNIVGDISSATSMFYTFVDCSSLEVVDMRGLTCSKTSISKTYYTFQGVPSTCKIIVKDTTEKNYWKAIWTNLTFLTPEEAEAQGISADFETPHTHTMENGAPVTVASEDVCYTITSTCTQCDYSQTTPYNHNWYVYADDDELLWKVCTDCGYEIFEER